MGYLYSNLYNTHDLPPEISPMNLLSFEMGNEDITLVCTYGKLSLLIERPVSAYSIGCILKTVSEIYSATSHDMDVVCDFDDIQKYQTMGYTLVSYGRFSGQYRVTFTVPFASDKALRNLTVAIFEEAKSGPVKKDFYWSGTDRSILRLCDELKELDGWRVKAVRNKEPEASEKT